ncbi:aldehyde dehydrogenase family protein [Halocatena salina]|uniref:Aldehyde dehydrogenase family protein n=1 Tax=Halocatena salina TaxID=2934340 RepID=A0A8T9ZYZ9_9EURY|nr:aldehyde dehydrogenase family protein [Halocatena salina]UPM41982.1 aldehyde dehydrogenase family protein [Halocatena salina]
MATHTARYDQHLYVDGDWESTPERIEVPDRAEGGTFAEIAAADADDARAALRAADRTKEPMRQTTIPERAGWCEEIADGLRARSDELATIIVREAGKPISSARGEVESAAERFDRAAQEIRHLKGEFREGTTEGHEGWEAIVKHEPVGTVLCITPYNYPLGTTALQVAPALAAGNSVVLTPSSKTPISAALLAEVISDVSLPPGAFNFVPGHGSEIGDVLAGDDRINTIAMTGSSAAGEHVAGVSGMVTLHMELGGNAPAVVCADADLDDVVPACTKGSLKYAGQRCSAVSRILAHESVHDELVERLDAEMETWIEGDLFDERTDFGPLISEDQAEWVDELVTDAVDRGARLIRGGEYDGRYYEPTLLADVPDDARLVYEEQFGPVATVTPVSDTEEALALANGSDLGLDACVFTQNYDRALSIADRLEAGSVRINGAPSHGLGDIPFGGIKQSGIGREGIDASIHAMLREKSVIL